MQIINISFFLGTHSLKVITGIVNTLTSRGAVQGNSEKREVETYLS